MDDDDMIETGYTIETGAPRRRRPPAGRSVYRTTSAIANRTPLTLPRQEAAFASAVPGIPTPGRRMRQLGLSPITFTNTSGTLLTMSVVCQKPFLPQRLFMDVARTGATAVGVLSISSAKIGADEQLISGGVPASMFFGAVQDIDLQWDESAAGLTIAMQVLISAAPGVGDSVVVVGALHGVTLN